MRAAGFALDFTLVGTLDTDTVATVVAAHTGVCLALVHAKDSQAAGLYRHFGFEPSTMDDLTPTPTTSPIVSSTARRPLRPCGRRSICPLAP